MRRTCWAVIRQPSAGVCPCWRAARPSSPSSFGYHTELPGWGRILSQFPGLPLANSVITPCPNAIECFWRLIVSLIFLIPRKIGCIDPLTFVCIIMRPAYTWKHFIGDYGEQFLPGCKEQKVIACLGTYRSQKYCFYDCCRLRTAKYWYWLITAKRK